jgi:hypothetical protein
MHLSNQQVLKTYARMQATAMIVWARDCFGFQKSWQPKIAVSFDKRRKFSYGGLYFSNKGTSPGINLAFSEEIFGGAIISCLEYEHYDTDPEIGSLYFLNWRQYVDAVLCHELAHAVQHSVILRLKVNVNRGVLRDFKGDWQDDDHGDLFQFCLRQFRREWMNDFIYFTFLNPPFHVNNNN